MYSVLLVDDEKSILESIQGTVPWEELGINQVLLAQNGQAALDILNNHTVHLLVTDIKMPGMDGLSLLRKVRELYPEIRCILLSAYGEFEYARAALTLGIENYLLKPLSVEELTASIQKSLENIGQSKKMDQNLFHDNILLRWITGSISQDELVERTPVLNVNTYARNYCIILLRKFNPNKNLVAISQKYADMLSRSYSVYTLTENKNDRIMILAAHEINPHTLLKQVKEVGPVADPGHDVLVAIGSVVFGNTELSKSYNTAQSTLQYATLFSSEHIIAFGETYDSHMSPTAQKRAQNVLEMPTVEAAIKEGHALLDSLFSLGSSQKEQHSLASEVGTLILAKAQEYLPARSLTYLEETLLGRCGSLSGQFNKEGYSRWLEELITETWLLYHSKTGNISPVVNQAIQYIRDNYSTSVSIKEFCNKFDMNASYLGYLFKNETGVFFNDYVSQIRIKNATWLLENTNNKISDIAAKVGFSNVSYFIKCFRSQTGLSPVKYHQVKLAEAVANTERREP